MQHEGAAHAAVLGRHHQQVAGAAARAVPVLGQRDRVHVVDGGDARRGAGPGDEGPGQRGAGPGQLAGEQVAGRRAVGPAEVERAHRQTVGPGDGGGHGHGGADASASRRAQQGRPGGGGRGEGLPGVGGHRRAHGLPGDDRAAQADQGHGEAVRVHLGGQGDRPGRVGQQPVRRPALPAVGFPRSRVRSGNHLDQP